jgi:hypothetical protein
MRAIPSGASGGSSGHYAPGLAHFIRSSTAGTSADSLGSGCAALAGSSSARASSVKNVILCNYILSFDDNRLLTRFASLSRGRGFVWLHYISYSVLRWGIPGLYNVLVVGRDISCAPPAFKGKLTRKKTTY